MKRNDFLLVIDIGNTSTSIGLVRGETIARVRRIAKADQSPAAIEALMRAVAGRRRIGQVGIASVVPPLNPWWNDAVEKLFGMHPRWVHHQLDLGVRITYPTPQTIGADRLANAAGGVERYGAPLIVADFGTAVTFDVITREDGYIGGIIAPGLPLMFDYLAERTAQLPKVSWKPIASRIGKNTAEAMQLGAQWGYRGMVREIIEELRRTPALKRARVCATGGFAERVLEGIRPKPVIDPLLTLHGIHLICRRNQA